MLIETETIIDKALLVWSPCNDIPEDKRKMIFIDLIDLCVTL